MQFMLTNKDVKNLKIFMLFHTKAVYKQRNVVRFILPIQFILFGFIGDYLLKTNYLLIASSIALGVVWFIFYPKFFDKNRKKHLNNTTNDLKEDVMINFNFDERKISYSPSQTPSENEIFSTKRVVRILECEENFFIVFAPETTIVLPNNEQTAACIKEISNLSATPCTKFNLTAS